MFQYFLLKEMRGQILHILLWVTFLIAKEIGSNKNSLSTLTAISFSDIKN